MDFAPASSKEFLDIQATMECGFTLKSVRDMIRTYSQVRVLQLLKELKKTEIRSHASALFVSARVLLLCNDICPISTQPGIQKFSW